MYVGRQESGSLRHAMVGGPVAAAESRMLLRSVESLQLRLRTQWGYGLWNAAAAATRPGVSFFLSFSFFLFLSLSFFGEARFGRRGGRVREEKSLIYFL